MSLSAAASTSSSPFISSSHAYPTTILSSIAAVLLFLSTLYLACTTFGQRGYTKSTGGSRILEWKTAAAEGVGTVFGTAAFGLRAVYPWTRSATTGGVDGAGDAGVGEVGKGHVRWFAVMILFYANLALAGLAGSAYTVLSATADRNLPASPPRTRMVWWVVCGSTVVLMVCAVIFGTLIGFFPSHNNDQVLSLWSIWLTTTGLYCLVQSCATLQRGRTLRLWITRDWSLIIPPSRTLLFLLTTAFYSAVLSIMGIVLLLQAWVGGMGVGLEALGLAMVVGFRVMEWGAGRLTVEKEVWGMRGVEGFC